MSVLSPEIVAALQAVQSSGEGLVCVSFRDGMVWRHRVSTINFPTAHLASACDEYAAQLKGRDDAKLADLESG